MNVVLTSESRFYRSPDGRYWTEGPLNYRFFERYLSVFGTCTVVARTQPVAQPNVAWSEASGANVSFADLPNFNGPWQFLRQRRAIQSRIEKLIQPGSAYLLRLPSPLGTELCRLLQRRRLNFGAEIVGDPWDVFAPSASQHPLRAVFRRYFAAQLRAQCLQAVSVAYVTEAALQRRYPPAATAFETHYSSIELADDAIVERPRVHRQRLDGPKIIAVGSLKQAYKGADVLLHAIASCHNRGIQPSLTWAGGGGLLPEMIKLAARLNISDRVRFVGHVADRATLQEYLDEADLFVLPSRQEGLPRATIEAMARALPCLGTTVGGFAELLNASCLVPPNDANALADRIRSVVADPETLTQMSADNWKRSRDYLSSQLRQRREAHYRYLLGRTPH
jgi:glycosyltransferase involved in cell wall biosynthesis